MKALSFNNWFQLNEVKGLKAKGVSAQDIKGLASQHFIGGKSELEKIDAGEALKVVNDALDRAMRNPSGDAMVGVVLLNKMSDHRLATTKFWIIRSVITYGTSTRDVSYTIVSNLKYGVEDARIYSTTMLIREMDNMIASGWDVYVYRNLENPKKKNKERRESGNAQYYSNTLNVTSSDQVLQFLFGVVDKIMRSDSLKKKIKDANSTLMEIIINFSTGHDTEYYLLRDCADFLRRVADMDNAGRNVLKNRSIIELENLYIRQLITGKLPSKKVSAEEYLTDLGF